MEGPLAFLIAVAGLSGWGAVFIQWWSQRDDWLRANFAVSLKDWRDHVRQSEVLYDVAEELAAALSRKSDVPTRALKQRYREQSAKKFGQDPRLELMRPSQLRATLRKIENRERLLETGFRLRFPSRRRKSLRGKG